jgi:hypothetical protein
MWAVQWYVEVCPWPSFEVSKDLIIGFDSELLRDRTEAGWRKETVRPFQQSGETENVT